jgi:glutamine amidotransferase
MKPDLAIIDYGMGNLRSVQRAWEAAGASTRIVQHPDAVNGADALVFPGQGAIRDCMRLLRATGFDDTIRDWIAADRPFFGICLGLQALFEHSEEADCPCLGVFPGTVDRFRLPPEFKVPHMGWNNVQFTQATPVSAGLEQGGPQFYFVHSYYANSRDPSVAWGQTEYGGRTFTSAACRGRCYATQFHPEKRQAKGIQLYRNFLASL